MRLLPLIALFLGLAGSGTLLCAAPTPGDIWKSEIVEPSALPARYAALDQGFAGLPPTLRPALNFQKTLLLIRSGAKVEAWRAELEETARIAGADPCAVALREISRAWLSRLSMREADAALLRFYRQHVCFPETLAEIFNDIPERARADAWGQPWAYSLSAPRQLSKLSSQRYTLGPARYPKISTLAEAIRATPAAPAWTLKSRLVAGSRVVEIRGAEGKTAVLQAGGRFEEAQVIYIGEGWVLFSDSERLFTLRF